VAALGNGRLASASDDKMVRVWDAGSGKCVLLEGHTEEVTSVCALRLNDGTQRIASASNDGTVRVWNTNSDGCLRTLQGQRFASLCDLGNGLLASASIPKAWHPISINSISSSSAPTATATARVWSVKTGDCLLPLEGHTDDITSMCALGDGRLASASKDTTVRVWNAESGACLVLNGHTGPVTSVCALGDGQLASASKDTTVRVWNAESGACLVVLEHTGPVTSVCALSDGRLASASWAYDSWDVTVGVWDAKSGEFREFDSSDPCAATVMYRALPSSSLPPEPHCGRTRAHFAPQAWGAPAVYLGSEVVEVCLFNLGGRRIASAALFNGQVHFLELVEPHPLLPLMGGGGT
jgi:WD40 repeat protein